MPEVNYLSSIVPPIATVPEGMYKNNIPWDRYKGWRVYPMWKTDASYKTNKDIIDKYYYGIAHLAEERLPPPPDGDYLIDGQYFTVKSHGPPPGGSANHIDLYYGGPAPFPLMGTESAMALQAR